MEKTALLGTLAKTSLVDFPGRLSCALFFEGCNLRCPYCYNGEVALAKIPNDEKISLEELGEFLKRRRNVLTGFVATGGEALLSPNLRAAISLAKSLGYKVKLDTNGVACEKLLELLGDGDARPDYVALDVKTAFSRYDEFSLSGGAGEKVKKSIQILSKMPSDSREFRTVLAPPLVSKSEIAEIAAFLPEDAAWFFAPFKNQTCLNPDFQKIAPYSPDEARALVDFAKSLRRGASLR